jgi:hypothetical protein
MVRKLKSPVLSEHINNHLYRLFFKTWQVSDDGSYHSPIEEDLGTYMKVKSGEPYDETITTYDPTHGPKTWKFKKLPQLP